MDFQATMHVSAMGMKAQSERIKVIAQNLANAQTTAETPGGDPYRRQMVTFKTSLDRQMGIDVVEVDKVTQDMTDFSVRYDPTHPAADDKGYIKLPNVHSLIEQMDMREAQRSYEANVGVIAQSRDMLLKTIELLRG